MRRIHTLVCAGVTLALSATALYAQSSSQRHPVIGTDRPEGFNNAELMALPEMERRAWIHAAVSLTVQYLSDEKAGRGACVADWYFGDGNGAAAIDQALEYWPEYPASATISGLAEKVCS